MIALSKERSTWPEDRQLGLGSAGVVIPQDVEGVNVCRNQPRGTKRRLRHPERLYGAKGKCLQVNSDSGRAWLGYTHLV